MIYLGVYTLVFLATFLIAYSPFLLDGKSFIWQNDGRSLYFPNLVYIGRALRRVFLGLTDGELSVPMFDISMSLGDDILGRLGSLESTDPLLLLSAFVPAQFCEYLYDFLTIFRVYLGGLASLSFAFIFQKKQRIF